MIPFAVCPKDNVYPKKRKRFTQRSNCPIVIDMEHAYNNSIFYNFLCKGMMNPFVLGTNDVRFIFGCGTTKRNDRRLEMALIKESFEKETLDAWRNYLSALEKSLAQLEADVEEAAHMSDICTDEWCTATEHVLDELGNALFSISEPRWSSERDSQRIKQLKRRLHDLYARYKGVASVAVA